MACDIPPIVAVDSMTLVWGIREEGTEEQCLRAKWLFEQFTKRQTQVVLPSVVVSEYLTPVEPQAHAMVIAQLEDRFIIQPFNVHCASIAAHLYQRGMKMRAKGEPGGRALLRADTMIIATAKAFGAEVLYTGDAGCRELAAKIEMTALDLPEPEKGVFGQYVD